MEGLTSRESYRLWLLKHELVYRNEADALADAHRLALLTAVKGAREDRERLRVSTVNSLNLARDPAARRVRAAAPPSTCSSSARSCSPSCRWR